MSAAASPQPSSFRFGDFDLDPATGELRKSGAPVRLKPQPFRVLVLLLTHPGDLVTREQIQKEVWGEGTFVDFEQGVNHCIKEIRSALEDDAESPRWVETLPRRGYRFVAPVETIEPRAQEPSASAGAVVVRRRLRPPVPWVVAGLAVVVVGAAVGLWMRPRHHAPLKPGRVMLAVLPFENLSGDQAQEYLSDGLTEEMITQLGRLQPERLGVIARTSAMRYKGTRKSVAEIGDELGVDYVLEGSVRRGGDRLRVSAQLILVSDQTHLWAENYEREMRDVLAIESEVALAIAGQIQARLGPGPPPRHAPPAVDPVLFEHYLRGRYFETRGLEKALGFFQQVVQRDPGYAPGHAALAGVYVVMGNWGTIPPKEALAKAQAEAHRALELDDRLPEAHLALAESTREPISAEREYLKALALDPNLARGHQSYGIFLTGAGRFEEALTHLQRAQELDPLSGIINANLAVGYFYLRRYDEAIAQSQRTLEIDPERITAHIDLGRAYAQKGLYPEAIAQFEKVRASGIAPRAAEALVHLTYTYARAGRQEEARRSLASLQEMATKTRVPAIYFVVCHSSLGDRDAAFRWLEKAVAEGDYDVYGLKVEPEFEGLRSDPRLPGVLQRLEGGRAP